MARAIKSAERTLALFELFSRCEHPLTVGQVARDLKIPQPSASMLLRNLTDLGYLEYSAAGRIYSPSIRVALLGSWINRRLNATGSLATRLDVMQRRTGETAYIAIQNGARAQYVLSQRANSPNQLDVESGMYRSLTASAPGRVLLSLRPDAEILTWVRRCNAEAEEDRFRTPEPEFLALMAQVRRNGYAETAGDVTPGLGAIAVTIRSPMGQMPLAVGVGGPIAQVAVKKSIILDELREFQAAFGVA